MRRSARSSRDAALPGHRQCERGAGDQRSRRGAPAARSADRARSVGRVCPGLGPSRPAPASSRSGPAPCSRVSSAASCPGRSRLRSARADEVERFLAVRSLRSIDLMGRSRSSPAAPAVSAVAIARRCTVPAPAWPSSAATRRGRSGRGDRLASGAEGFALRRGGSARSIAHRRDVEKALGPIDILVNNAGLTRDNILLRMNDDDWDAVLDANLRGAFLAIRAVARG